LDLVKGIIELRGGRSEEAGHFNYSGSPNRRVTYIRTERYRHFYQRICREHSLNEDREVITPGRRVNLTYYEGADLTESYGWVVLEYEDGLLKAYNPGGKFKSVSKRLDGAIIQREEECLESGPVIFNLRSSAFLKVELLD
jgi:hypothetical protein